MAAAEAGERLARFEHAVARLARTRPLVVVTEDRRYDVAVIGAGVVGTAIARQLARYDCAPSCSSAADDVGTGTSKANTAIVHTGFDTAARKPRVHPGPARPRPAERLRAARAGSRRADRCRPGGLERGAGGPARRRAGQGAGQRLRTRAPGLTLDELARREPHLGRRARRGPSPSPTSRSSVRGARASPSPPRRSAPASSCASVWTSSMSGATATSWLLQTSGGPIRADWVVNAAGLGADLLNRRFGHDEFTIAPGGASSSSSTSWPARSCRPSSCRSPPSGRRACWSRRPSTATCSWARRPRTSTTAVTPPRRRPVSTACSRPDDAYCPSWSTRR